MANSKTAPAVAGLIGITIGLASPEIVRLEGDERKAYKDIAGVLTVCSGHTGKDIVPSKLYSEEECRNITRKDVETFLHGVLETSPHLAWHPAQLAATVSFTYNVGVGAYSKSSVARLFNEGRFKEACDYLTKYVYVKGKKYQGLVNRRRREQELCLSTLTAEGSLNAYQ